VSPRIVRGSTSNHLYGPGQGIFLFSNDDDDDDDDPISNDVIFSFLSILFQ
jgi:hypothetical protein